MLELNRVSTTTAPNKEFISQFSFFPTKNVCCGYSLEAPWQGTSNEYHIIGFCKIKIAKIAIFFG